MGLGRRWDRAAAPGACVACRDAGHGTGLGVGKLWQGRTGLRIRDRRGVRGRQGVQGFMWGTPRGVTPSPRPPDRSVMRLSQHVQVLDFYCYQ